MLQPCNLIDAKISLISPIYQKNVHQILNQVEGGKEDYCSSEHFVPNDCWISLTGHFNRKVDLKNLTLLHRMSLIIGKAKEYRSMTVQLMSQNLPKRSLWDFVFMSSQPFRAFGRKQYKCNHYLPIPRGPCSSKSRFFLAYLNCKYFP